MTTPPTDLTEALRLHRLWRVGDPAGERADFSGADMTGASLARADLAGADLTGADLTGAIYS